MNKSTPHNENSALRLQAEARLKESPARTEAESKRLVHELEVHQLELEIQNAELVESRNRVEALLRTYTDLYDFAPVGYFSLDETGMILESNLTGAALLGIERGLLTGRSFLGYLVPEGRSAFKAFLSKVFLNPEKQIFEAMFRHKTRPPFWADIQAEPSPDYRGSQKWCRVAISDLSTLKQAEEARKRAEALAVANDELNREIAHRAKVELALKKSEGHFAKLLEESREMELQFRLLSRQLLKAQEDERKQISRDLHDEIIQVLVGINVNLASLSLVSGLELPGLKKRIYRTQRQVEKAVDIVHRFARELRPGMLDDLGLIPAVKAMCDEFTKRTKLVVTIEASSKADRINSAKQTVLFRITQAALSNIQKHSGASTVRITINETSEFVQFQIHDNGKSFDVAKELVAKKYKRLGLIGSRERVEMVGGRFEIVSSPGNGTLVTAEIPLDSPKPTKNRPDL